MLAVHWPAQAGNAGVGLAGPRVASGNSKPGPEIKGARLAQGWGSPASEGLWAQLSALRQSSPGPCADGRFGWPPGPLCPQVVALQQDKGKWGEGVEEGAPQQSKGAMSKEQQLITGCVRLLSGAAVAKVKLPHCTTDAVARSHTSRPWPLLLAQKIGVSVIRSHHSVATKPCPGKVHFQLPGASVMLAICV